MLCLAGWAAMGPPAQFAHPPHRLCSQQTSPEPDCRCPLLDDYQFAAVWYPHRRMERSCFRFIPGVGRRMGPERQPASSPFELGKRSAGCQTKRRHTCGIAGRHRDGRRASSRPVGLAGRLCLPRSLLRFAGDGCSALSALPAAGPAAAGRIAVNVQSLSASLPCLRLLGSGVSIYSYTIKFLLS